MTLLALGTLEHRDSPTVNAAEGRDLIVGVAVVDITPPRGWRMSGYFNERLNTGVHDPLQAKALVLKQGNTQAALVFCDLIGVTLDVSSRARKLASQQTGIPTANILVHGTHSHTGPLYGGALRNFFHDQAVKANGADPHEPIDYPTQLAARIAQAVVAAQKSRTPVTLSAGYATQAGLSFNRRFHMKDGTVRFNPGKLNPDIVRAAGPVDPQVGLLAITPRNPQQTATLLTSFPLHLDTVGGTEYSADYPLYLESALREKLGASLVSLFGTGTCGDLNHIDVSHNRPQKGQEEAARIGNMLASTVLTELPRLRPVTTPKLAVRSATVQVPLQRYSDDEIASARQNMFKIGSRDLPFLDQVKAAKIVDLQLRPGPTSPGPFGLPMEVHVFRVSDDVAIVGLPGEIFVELGLAIKQASPFATTLVVELCNDNPHYVPTKKAFAEGSYETVNSFVASGGGELLVETAVRLLKELGGAKTAATSANGAEIVELRKIWDQAPHNAFTDLVRFNGKWFCAFREGKAHVSPDGAIRVITSTDGNEWQSAARLTSAIADLRDAKLTVMPDGRLLLIAAGALHQPAAARHQSMTWLSRDGVNWDEGHEVGDPDFWLWRVTWHRGTAYGISYSTNPERSKRTIQLHRSRDGVIFETVASNLIPTDFPSESTLRFLRDDTGLCLLRRDGDTFSAQLGTARPPYTEWKWKDLGVRIGGPNFIQLPDGRFVAATRLHDGKVRTTLSWLDPQAGTLKEFLPLPSGGDSSYPGLVWHEGLLWVSYYSSHEGKTSIYLAKVRLPKA